MENRPLPSEQLLSNKNVVTLNPCCNERAEPSCPRQNRGGTDSAVGAI